MEGSRQDSKCLLSLSGSSLSSQSTGTETLTLDGTYCEQQIFQSLSLQHLELLEDRGHLRHIRKTRNEMLKKKDV